MSLREEKLLNALRLIVLMHLLLLGLAVVIGMMNYPRYGGTADNPLLGGYRLYGFEGWGGDQDYNSYITETFTENLPTRFLQHYYVNPFYDGETFYLYAYSFGELLELIRKFVEPSDEIGDVLDSSTEMRTYRNTITEIFKN